VTGSLSPRTRGLLALGGASLIAALATGRPELALLAGPFLLFVGAGLTLAREPRVTAGIEVDSTRLLEGEPVAATVTVGNAGAGAVEVELTVAHTRRLVLEPSGTMLLRLQAGQTVDVELAVRPEKWGAHTIGPLIVRARDPLGLTSWGETLGQRVDVRAFPREQRLRELVVPRRTHPPVPRSPRRTGPRRGNRVRGHPAVPRR
jgi:uncharacterized protein (DUF58 family)